jgi:hypothetical protein
VVRGHLHHSYLECVESVFLYEIRDVLAAGCESWLQHLLATAIYRGLNAVGPGQVVLEVMVK